MKKSKNVGILPDMAKEPIAGIAFSTSRNPPFSSAAIAAGPRPETTDLKDVPSSLRLDPALRHNSGLPIARLGLVAAGLVVVIGILLATQLQQNSNATASANVVPQVSRAHESMSPLDFVPVTDDLAEIPPYESAGFDLPLADPYPDPVPTGPVETVSVSVQPETPDVPSLLSQDALVSRITLGTLAALRGEAPAASPAADRSTAQGTAAKASAELPDATTRIAGTENAPAIIRDDGRVNTTAILDALKE